MKRNRQLAAAGVMACLALAACEAAPEAEQDAGQTELEQEDAAAPAEQPGVIGATGPAEPRLGAIELASIDHSGVSGTVVVERGGDEVTIDLALQGLEPGAGYSAHVHDGKCAAGGPVRVPFDALEVDEAGEATARLTAGAERLPGHAPVFVQVHDADGAAVACADLSQPASDAADGAAADTTAGG